MNANWQKISYFRWVWVFLQHSVCIRTLYFTVRPDVYKCTIFNHAWRTKMGMAHVPQHHLVEVKLSRKLRKSYYICNLMFCCCLFEICSRAGKAFPGWSWHLRRENMDHCRRHCDFHSLYPRSSYMLSLLQGVRSQPRQPVSGHWRRAHRTDAQHNSESWLWLSVNGLAGTWWKFEWHDTPTTQQ